MAMQTCVVTGKVFDDEKGGYKWNHEGTWYYFTDIGARNKFIGNPQKYLEQGAAQPSS